MTSIDHAIITRKLRAIIKYLNALQPRAALDIQTAPSAGLRNRLVHEYEDINPHIVFQSIRMALEIYPEYIQQVQIYLERQNAP